MAARYDVNGVALEVDKMWSDDPETDTRGYSLTFDGNALGFIYPTELPGIALTEYIVDLLNEEVTGYFEERHWEAIAAVRFRTLAQAARAVVQVLKQTAPVYSPVLATLMHPGKPTATKRTDPGAIQIDLFAGDPQPAAAATEQFAAIPEEEEIW